MGLILIIGIIVMLCIMVFLIVKEKRDKKMEKELEAVRELDLIKSKLKRYKESCIDGFEIDEITSTPLDNIASFMTETYPKLSEWEKIACNEQLFVYSPQILDMTNQILKEIDEGAPLKPDSWYKAHSRHLAQLYINLLRLVYPHLTEKHKEEFNKLSAYKYNEMKDKLEVWKIDDEYKVNEKLTKRN